MSQIPFCGPSYQGRSLNVNASRCVNFFPELTGAQDDKAKLILVGTPGTLIKTAVGLGSTGAPVRALYSFAGHLYVIAASGVYAINTEDWSSSLVGTLSTSTGRVSIVDNGQSSNGVGGDQLLIVDGTHGYTYNVKTSTFATITDADFIAKPDQAAYLDGYFVVSNSTMQVQSSDLFDGTSYNGLATAAVSAFPDSVQATVTHNQQLFFIKEYTTEVWYDTATPTTEGFPFGRVSGAVFDYGTPAKWSVAKGGSSIFFVCTSRTNENGSLLGVVQVDSYQPQVISTAPISYKVSTCTDFSQLFAYCYSDQGHVFYVLTSTADNWTLVYDVATQMWHERSSFDDGTSTSRHLSNCYTYHAGKHYVGDYRASYIAEMNMSYGSDTNLPIESFRVTPHEFDNNSLKPIFISRLDIDMEAGVGVPITNGYQYLGFNADGEINPWGMETAGDYSQPPIIDLLFKANGSILANGVFPAGAVVQAEETTDAYLSWSDDGGHTYSKEYKGSLGTFGDYLKRLVWRRLGTSRSRVWKLRSNTRNKKIVIGAYARIGL